MSEVKYRVLYSVRGLYYKPGDILARFGCQSRLGLRPRSLALVKIEIVSFYLSILGSVLQYRGVPKNASS